MALLGACGLLTEPEPAEVVEEYVLGAVRFTARAARSTDGKLEVTVRAENLGDTTVIAEILGGPCTVIPRGYKDQTYRHLVWEWWDANGECVLVPHRFSIPPRATDRVTVSFNAGFGGRSLHVTGEIDADRRVELAAGLVPP